MSKLFYMSLAGIGEWPSAMKTVGAQLGPYRNYLRTAIEAIKRGKPVLAWRAASKDEVTELQRRLRDRIDRANRYARKQKKRRDRRLKKLPQGGWVILEPPKWRPEEPESTFEAFLESPEVYQAPACHRGSRLSRLAYDHEYRALLLDSQPEPHEPEKPAEQRGRLLWLKPNTYPLDCQRRAFEDLENRPAYRLAPLVRLFCNKRYARWPDFSPRVLREDDWAFIRREAGALRDGSEEQRRFVSRALETPDFAILDGPPGSGKTTAICELIVQLARQGKRILLCASTHVAVDNVLERLIHYQDESEEKIVLPVRIGDEGRVTSLAVEPFIYTRQLDTWRKEILDFLDDPRGSTEQGGTARGELKTALAATNDETTDSIARLLLDSANLVCGTTIGILQHPDLNAARRGGSPAEPFDVMILDEASKTTFGEFLVPALHARKWIVVGDVRQLSPYVEDSELADNLKNLAPERDTRAAAHAYFAMPRGRRSTPRRASLARARTEEERTSFAREAASRGVAYADLNELADSGDEPALALLYAGLVFGDTRALKGFEQRLSPELDGSDPALPELPDFRAAHRASPLRRRGEDPIDWSSELSWRIVRAFELRQNKEESDRYTAEIEQLTPQGIGEDWYRWRKMKAGRQPAPERLKQEINTIKRVALPSILELLERGFERLPNWRDGVAITDGLPASALRERMVSLSYQHRMHPEISRFPRAQFYSESGGLLRDATGMPARRAWDYQRYVSRAHWIAVSPSRRSSRNENEQEAKRLLEELEIFCDWAQGQPENREAAVLTFYRAQESLLRERLRRLAKQPGRMRNFEIGKVKITLCTVDRFQGHEADIVFLSFVKSGRVGFLNSPNRLNVALTRARYQVVLVGDQRFFASERCRSELLKNLGRSDAYTRDIELKGGEL